MAEAILFTYLITTAGSGGIYLLASCAFKNKIKKEGKKKKKESLSENVLGLLRSILCLMIPVINLTSALMLLFDFEKYYEALKKELEESGKVYKMFKTNSSNDLAAKKIKDSMDNSKNIENEKAEKAYSEMTTDEKLEWLERELTQLKQEKEYLTNTSNIQDTKEVVSFQKRKQ